MNSSGRRQVALGWYALAGALFATDRDSDGLSDGDELLAGTCPTNAADVLSAACGDVGQAGRMGLQWQTETGRWYTISQATQLNPSVWMPVVSNLTGSGLLSYTVNLSTASSAFRVDVHQ